MSSSKVWRLPTGLFHGRLLRRMRMRQIKTTCRCDIDVDLWAGVMRGCAQTCRLPRALTRVPWKLHSLAFIVLLKQDVIGALVRLSCHFCEVAALHWISRRSRTKGNTA